MFSTSKYKLVRPCNIYGHPNSERPILTNPADTTDIYRYLAILADATIRSISSIPGSGIGRSIHPSVKGEGRGCVDNRVTFSMENHKPTTSYQNSSIF